MTLLSKLTLSASHKSTKGDALARKKDKLINRLNLQLDMAKALIEGTEFTAYKEKWQRDPDTNDQVKKRIPKNISKMWYIRNNVYYIEVKYGSKSLELAKNKYAIALDSKEDLVPTFELLIQAIADGDLDEQLNAISTPLNKKK